MAQKSNYRNRLERNIFLCNRMLSGYVRTHFHIVYYGNFIVFIEISGNKNTFIH